MDNESFPRTGEVWFVAIPNQPKDSHQPRTAIIVSTNGRNRGANDVIVVPTTSAANFRPHPEVHVHLPQGEGGLKKNFYARCDQVTTIDKVLLSRGPLGRPIALAYRNKIVEGIRIAIGDTRS